MIYCTLYLDRVCVVCCVDLPLTGPYYPAAVSGADTRLCVYVYMYVNAYTVSLSSMGRDGRTDGRTHHITVCLVRLGGVDGHTMEAGCVSILHDRLEQGSRNDASRRDTRDSVERIVGHLTLPICVFLTIQHVGQRRRCRL